MTTRFVLMYHPNLGNVQVEVSVESVDEHAQRGWLLVDPDEEVPAPSPPWLTIAAGDSRYATAAALAAKANASAVTAALAAKADASAVTSALAAKADASALAAKADLVSGAVPDAQLPTRLADTALKAAYVAVEDGAGNPVQGVRARVVIDADGDIITIEGVAA